MCFDEQSLWHRWSSRWSIRIRLTLEGWTSVAHLSRTAPFGIRSVFFHSLRLWRSPSNCDAHHVLQIELFSADARYPFNNLETVAKRDTFEWLFFIHLNTRKWKNKNDVSNAFLHIFGWRHRNNIRSHQRRRHICASFQFSRKYGKFPDVMTHDK